jgi:hypothetical protein
MRMCQALILAVALLFSLSASAGQKQKGTVTLKDLQPAGITSKQEKDQIYDFTFEASGHQYTCRTSRDKKINAAEFIVGNTLNYEIDGNKAKLKNTNGKEAKCTIVRVENVTAAVSK